jgi:hypothetical protein
MRWHYSQALLELQSYRCRSRATCWIAGFGSRRWTCPCTIRHHGRTGNWTTIVRRQYVSEHFFPLDATYRAVLFTCTGKRHERLACDCRWQNAERLLGRPYTYDKARPLAIRAFEVL